MRFGSSILLLLTLLKGYECSNKKRTSKTAINSWNKSSSTHVASSLPVNIDLSSVVDVAIGLPKSPLRIIEKNAKHLALDFCPNDSSEEDDDELQLTLFHPKSENIYDDDSWNAPLNQPEKWNNLLSLKSKMEKIRKSLSKELVDDAFSFSWISNAKTIANYISIVSISFTQLAYLISRLRHTSGCPPESVEIIHENVKDHLKVLERFCFDMKEYSGVTGLSFSAARLKEPSQYFKSMLVLRDEISLELNDSMFKTFIEFVFDAYATEFTDTMTTTFLDYTSSDKWIPLPIVYLRDRFLLEQPEEFATFICKWRFKAFEGYRFDTRHLISLGELMQQSMISHQVFSNLIELARVNGHNTQYAFDENLIKFLTFTASSPHFLPNDPEISILIGNYSSPHLSVVPIAEDEKIKLIVGYWEFFAGSADFSLISKENYVNLCALIQKLDQVYPGISESLWSHVNGTTSECEMKANDFYQMIQSRIKTFNTEIDTFKRKSDYLQVNFSISETAEHPLSDSKSLYLVLEFFTDVLTDTMSAMDSSKAEIEELGIGEHVTSQAKDVLIEEYDACKDILDHCISFIDLFLIKCAKKAMISHWYSKYEFHPTRLFTALNDLWISGDCPRLSESNCTIWENVNKLVDNNLSFALLFMTILRLKTGLYSYPALSAKMPTPKCLIASGHSDVLNLDFFRKILEIAKNGILLDHFFSGLSQKLTKKEISFKSAIILLEELEASDPKICFDMTADGYSEFWDPSLIISTMAADCEQIEDIKSFFKSYLRVSKSHYSGDGSVFTVTSDFMRNVSTLIGFNRNIFGQVNAHAEGFNAENISAMVLSPDFNDEKLLQLALTLFQEFYSIITNGLPLKIIRKLFERLLEIAKVVKDHDFNNSEDYTKFVYSYNTLLLSIIRIPAFTIPEEDKAILVLYEFYRKSFRLLPEPFENLSSAVKSSSTLLSLYTRIVAYHDVLPPSAFDNPILVSSNKKQINKIQMNYVRNIISDPENMTQTCMSPISKWIRIGKMDVDAFLKLLTGISPQLPINDSFNYIPLIAEFLKSPLYAEISKIKALNVVFNKDNDGFMRSLCNRRYSTVHEMFLEMFLSNPAGIKFMETRKDAIWYEGFVVEISRLKARKIDQSHWNTDNFAVKSDAYMRDYLNLIRSGEPDYLHKEQMVRESEMFVERTADLLPLLRDSDFLRSCYMTVTNWNWEIAANSSTYFFRIYATPETFIKLFNMHVSLLPYSMRRCSLLNIVIEWVRVPEIRSSILKLITMLINQDDFILNKSSLKIIQNWFTPAFISDYNLTFESFISSLIHSLFDKITANSSTKGLDEMFSVFIDLIESKLLTTPSSLKLNNDILDGLFVLQAAVLDNSTKLMSYLRVLIEAFPSDHDLCLKVMNLLSDLSGIYVRAHSDWTIIWKQIHQTLPAEFVGSNPLNVFVKLGTCTDYDEWSPYISVIREMNLPSKILIGLVESISESSLDDEFEFELILLLPKEIEFQDFVSFDQVEAILILIEKTFESLENDMFNNDSEVTIDLSSGILEKFIMLLDLESRNGVDFINYGWTWRQLMIFVRGCTEYEEILINLLLTQYPELIKNSTKSELSAKWSILSFIYEIQKFTTREDSQIYDDLIMKCTLIYNELSNYVQEVNDDEDTFVLSRLQVMSDEIVLKDFGDLNLLFQELMEFRSIFRMKAGRQDELASLGLNYAFTIVSRLHNSEEEKSEILIQICELLVEIINEILSSDENNLISLAKTINEARLEGLITILSKNVYGDSVAKFSFIIAELMKFSSIDVSDLFYQQISDKNVRLDVCFINREMINLFDDVNREGFDIIQNHQWPELYLEGIIESESITIDLNHFEMIEYLIKEIGSQSIDYTVIFRKLEDLVERVPFIFTFCERILLKENVKMFYSSFMTNSITKFVIEKKNISFIKALQKFDSLAFEKWKEDENQAGIRNLLIKFLQEDQDAAKSRMFTMISERIIQKIESNELKGPSDLVSFISNYKNLDIMSVEPQVLFTLINLLIEKINMAPESWNQDLSKSLVTLSNTLQWMESGTRDEFINLAVRMFNEDVFVDLIDQMETKEDFKNMIDAFSSKISVMNLKTIKSKLSRFGLADDREILISAAKNSEPSQLFEYLQKLKKVTLELKLELLSFCKVVLQNDKVLNLINYYNTMILSNPKDLEMIVVALFENNSALSCFTSPISKSNMKNRSAFLGEVKNQLNHRKAISLVDRINNPIGKLLINLTFRASSTQFPLISADINVPLFRDFLINYVSSINDESSKNKTSMYLKAFKLYEEIDRRDPSWMSDNSILIGIITGLYGAMKQNNYSFSFIPSESSVYAFYKLAQRLPTSRKERYNIIRKLLFPHPRQSCFTGFLRAQPLEPESIDWLLHDDLRERAKWNPFITRLLDEFKEKHQESNEAK